jgi:hypothetical protein
VILTGGNRNDVTQLMPLLDAVPPVRGRVGRPRRKPEALFADRGYDHDVYRDQARAPKSRSQSVSGPAEHPFKPLKNFKKAILGVARRIRP